MRCLESTTDSVDVNLSKVWEIVEGRGAWLAVVHRATEEGDTMQGLSSNIEGWTAVELHLTLVPLGGTSKN